MNVEYISRNNAPSLISNGNFSQGTSYWFGSYVRHNKVLSAGSISTDETPRYSASVIKVDDGYYPQGIPAGLNQFIDYPNTYSFPSSVRVGRVDILPVSKSKLFVRLIPGASTVDGRLLATANSAVYSGPGDTVPGDTFTYSTPIDRFFQHPFVYRDSQSIVPVNAGSDVHITDSNRSATSGSYRAGRVIYNYLGSAVPNTPNTWAYTQHGLEVVSSSDVVEPIFSSESGDIITTTATYSSGDVTVSIRGTVMNALLVDRGLDTQAVGIKPGDVFKCDSPDVVGVITAIRFTAGSPDQLDIDLIPLRQNGLLYYPFFTASSTLDSWAIFAPSVGTVTVTKNVFKYDLTLSYTYDTSSGYGELAPSILQFYEVDDGDSSYVTLGVGYPNEIIPNIPEDTQTVALVSGVAINPTWVRKIEHFYRESALPITGRLLLSLIPEDNSVNTNNTKRIIEIQHIATPTLAYPFGGFLVESDDVLTGFNVGTLIDFRVVIYPSAYDPNHWVYTDLILNGPFVIKEINGNTFTVAAKAEANGGIPDTYTISNPDAYQELYTVSDLLPFGRGNVSNVSLVKGDYSQGLYRSDDPPPGITAPERIVDDLRQGVDHFDNILPTGTVVLYAGGEACPNGFKRVDGVGEEDAGLPGYHDLPAPSEVVYDPDTDRTVLKWDNTRFPVVDATGNEIPLAELAESVTFSPIDASLGVSDEIIDIIPVQQVMQPGMSLRVREFELSQTPSLINNPAIQSGLPSQALFLKQPSTVPVTSGEYVECFDYPLISTSAPVPDSLAIEMWFMARTGGTNVINMSGGILPTTVAEKVLVQKINNVQSGPIRFTGWEIFMDNHDDVHVRLFRNASAHTDAGATWVFKSGDHVSTTFPSVSRVPPFETLHQWLHMVVTLDRISSTSNSLFKIKISNTTTQNSYEYETVVSNLLASQFINSGPLTLGRGNSQGNNIHTLANSADINIDMFRMFSALNDTDIDLLWNNGQGLARVPTYLEGSLLAEFRFDGANNDIAHNTATGGPTNDATIHVTSAGGSIHSTIGHIFQLNSIDEALAGDFLGPFERKTKSFLITDMSLLASQNPSQSFPSAKPYRATTPGPLSAFGNGYGSINYPMQITGTEITALLGVDYVGVQPLGPIGSDQDNQFTINGVTGIPASVAPGTVSGMPDNSSTPTTVSFFIHDDVSAINKKFNPIARVGDVYYIKWNRLGQSVVGEFIGELTKIVSYTDGKRYTFKRYDGLPMDLKGNLGVNCVFSIAPAKLFGTGTQRYDSVTGTFTFDTVVQNKFVSIDSLNNSDTYWTHRLIAYDLEVSVKGKLELPTVASKVYIEPSGYLQYGVFAGNVDYGSGGHSHLVEESEDDITVSNLIPRINEQNSAINTEPFYPLASSHTHGYLNKYVWPLPMFRLFTLCEKL